jgi:hypothetical protein
MARRRAWRCLAWTLASWLVFSVVLLIHVQLRRPDLVAPEFYARLDKLRQARSRQPARPLWLVMGSSRIGRGYLPESVEPLRDGHGRAVLTFNFAQDGMGPVLQHVHLRRLLREGIRPELIVLEQMPMYLYREFNHCQARLALWRELPVVASYSGFPAVARNAAVRQVEIYPAAAQAVLPAGLRRQLSLDHEGPADWLLPRGGLARLFDRVSDAERREHIRLQQLGYRDRMAGFRICAAGERALRDSLALCRREGIAVVLLLAPEGESYRQLYPAGAEELVGAFVRRLGAEAGVLVVDARRWLAEEDFYDGHHAQRQGALKFTRRLHAEVLAPLARAGGRKRFW